MSAKGGWVRDHDGRKKERAKELKKKYDLRADVIATRVGRSVAWVRNVISEPDEAIVQKIVD